MILQFPEPRKTVGYRLKESYMYARLTIQKMRGWSWTSPSSWKQNIPFKWQMEKDH